MDCAAAPDGQLDACVELSGDDKEMRVKLSIVWTDPFMKTMYLICIASFAFLLASCASDSLSVLKTSNQSRAGHWLKSMKAGDYFDSQAQVDLADAITKGDTNKMQTAIVNGADVNYSGRDGMRPLFWAVAKQKITGFRFLLDHGADPNVIIKSPHSVSALGLCVTLRNSEYFEELLKHGANPNAPYGDTPQTTETPIFSAILYNRIDRIALLLKHGADIEWKLSNDTTPLHAAIYDGNYRAALFLFHAGSSPLVKNKLGYAPVDTMRQFGDNGVLTHADEKAYKELLKEFREKGLIDKSNSR
jgi:ankyrin repeat protein